MKDVYVVVDLSDEDEISVSKRLFGSVDEAKAHVRGQFADGGEDLFEDEDGEPALYWEGDDLYNEEGRVLYMIRKVSVDG